MAVALVAVLIAVLITYRSAGQSRAEIAAADLVSKSGQLMPYDSYGAVQLALRAYRTNSGVSFPAGDPPAYPGADRVLPDYTMSTRNISAPGETTSRSAALQSSRDLGALSRKVSADGRRMATLDSAGRVVVWTIVGGEVSAAPLTALFNDLDRASTVTISRSGRYVAFVETVLPVLPPTGEVANAPVDGEGVPTGMSCCQGF